MSRTKSKQTASGDVPEKCVAEAKIAMRPFDQTRDVRHRRAAIIGEINHADHRVQGRKRIRRHLRMGRGNSPQKRRLSGVRVTDQPGVGDRAQLENESPLLSFFTLRVLARRAIARALEMDVSFAAFAAVTKNKLFVRQSEVRDLFERRLGAVPPFSPPSDSIRKADASPNDSSRCTTVPTGTFTIVPARRDHAFAFPSHARRSSP